MAKSKPALAKKMYGTEPEPDFHIRSEFDLSKALTWYSALPETDNFEWPQSYMVDQGRPPEFIKAVSAHKKHLPGTFFAIARLHNRGIELPYRVIKNLDTKLETLAAMPVLTPVIMLKPVHSSNLERTIADIDMADDMLSVIGLDCEIKITIPSNLSKDDREILQNRYRKLYDELAGAVRGDDPELKEAYRNNSTAALNRRIAFLASIVNPQNVSPSRKASPPAQKPAIPHTKKIGDWASISPQKIVGVAKTLIVAKPKTNTVMVYVAKKDTTLGITAGGKFTNVDSKKSFSVVYPDAILNIRAMNKELLLTTLMSNSAKGAVDLIMSPELFFARAFA